MPVSKGKAGVKQEMHKFKAGKLHSGSKHGPVVKSKKQAVAIALSEAGMSKYQKKSAHGSKQFSKEDLACGYIVHPWPAEESKPHPNHSDMEPVRR